MARISVNFSRLLTEELLLKLNNYRIYNIIDYLKEDPHTLFRILKIPFKDVLFIRQELIMNFNNFPKQGSQYYNYILSKSAIIPTYIQGLDNLLDGGILTQNLIELCGLTCSGKTHLCLTISSNIAQNKSNEVIFYIDTKGDFSGQKIHQILVSRKYTEEEISKIMSRIRVIPILDVYQLCSLLYNFDEKLLSEFYSVRLVIIDSLPPIIYPLMTKNKGLGYLNNLSNVLKYIMEKYNVTIIIVNNVTRWIEEEKSTKMKSDEDDEEEKSKILIEKVKPTLGKFWMSVPNTRLLLEREGKKIKISLKKNTYLPVNSHCNLAFDKYAIV